jgi:protein MpaA
VTRGSALLFAVALMGAASCSGSDEAGTSVVTTTAGAAESTTIRSTTTGASTTTAATTTIAPPPTALMTTTAPTTTETPTTSRPPKIPTLARPADFLGEQVIGTSAGGRPIVAAHRGTPGGKIVLVVGVIHGNENAGLAIVERLSAMPIPAGIDLWLLPLMNPDGYANDVRGNERGVDLNRNFPHDWTPIATPGDWQYSGSGPGSEPETQAYMEFAAEVGPALTLWYHQDLFRVSPSSGRDGPLRQRYAELTGLPYVAVSGPGSVYTGVAATWTRRTLPSAMSFIVELGPTLPDDEVQRHADAVIAVAAMA